MSRPQSPELHRSGRIASLDPDNVATRLEAHRDPRRSGPSGPVPEANQPGHHPEHDQDKPDLASFVRRFNRTDPIEPERSPGRSGAHAATRVIGRVTPLARTAAAAALGGTARTANALASVAGRLERRVQGPTADADLDVEVDPDARAHD